MGTVRSIFMPFSKMNTYKYVASTKIKKHQFSYYYTILIVLYCRIVITITNIITSVLATYLRTLLHYFKNDTLNFNSSMVLDLIK